MPWRRLPEWGDERRGWLLWAALALGGQAATLALVRAGSKIGYQHFPLPGDLLARGPRWALTVLAVQSAVVCWSFWRARRAVGASLRQIAGPRLALLLALMASTSAALSLDPGIWAVESAVALALALVQLATVAGFAVRVPAALAEACWRRALGPREDDAARAPGHSWRWALGWGAVATLIAAALAAFAYQRHPHVPDEVAYLFQARTFASGRLSVPLPAVPVAFETYLLWARDGRWFSVYPPGWPAVLAVGELAGAAWLVNPLLCGLDVVLADRLLRRLVARPAARLATALFAVSPWNLFLGMSFMSHSSSLAVALLAALAVARLRDEPSVWRWALAGGAAIGALVLFRPLEAAIVALTLGLWSLGIPELRARVTATVRLALATATAGTAALFYNRMMMGRWLDFPVMSYMEDHFGPGSNSLGFGAQRGAGWTALDPLPGHGLVDVAINTALNLFSLQVDLFGWSVGSLLAVWVALVFVRPRPGERWVILALAAVVLTHSLYWFSGGPDFGARYWHLAVVPFVALGARGVEALAERAEELAPGRGRGRVLAAVALLVLGSLFVFVPWRGFDKYRHYRGMSPDLCRMAADEPWADALVLVRGRQHPDWASAMACNPLEPRAGLPLFARDRNLRVLRRLVAAYPQRRFWVVDGPTVTGDGYHIVAGPLDGEALLAERRAPKP